MPKPRQACPPTPLPRAILPSPGVRTRVAATLVAICLGLPAGGAWAAPGDSAQPSGANTLPRLGDGVALSLAAERRLGERIARHLYQDPMLVEDPALTDYLDAIWQPLLQAARSRGELEPAMDSRFAWTLLMSRERSLNAFALPGGFLGIHLGLIGNADSADELAAVLGHELSHITQRHIARLMAAQDARSPLVLGAMILGALAAGAAGNVDVGTAVIASGQAAAMQAQLSFSRDMEREADRVGFGVATQAGFDGQGYVGLLGKLADAARLNDGGAYPYLRSHPMNSERMADMQARLPREPSGPAAARLDPAWHTMMAARAQVLSSDAPDGYRLLGATGAARTDGAGDLATLSRHYAAALSAARLRDTGKALGSLAALRAWPMPDAQARAAVLGLSLEVLLMTGARATLDGASLSTLRAQALAAPQRALRLLGAQAALAEGEPGPAMEALQEWLAQHPEDGPVWQQLAGLCQAAGLPLRAVRAEAEARLARYDLPGARDRLKAAASLPQGGTDEHFDRSIIDARLREVEARLSRQTLARDED